MKCLVISLVICVAAFHITHSIFQSCSGKPFICKNSTHFQICTDIGDNITITLDDILQACPDGAICKMTNAIECTGPVLSTLKPNITTVKANITIKANVTTVKPKVTTVKPKVTTVKPKVTTVKPVVTNCPREGNFANPSDCHSYYKCKGSQIITVNCPWNTVFSPVAGMCTHEKESCGSTVDEIPCYLNGRFRDPKNCQSYVNCQREGGKWKKSKVYCSSHYSFNEMSGKCVYSNRGCH